MNLKLHIRTTRIWLSK